MHFRSKLCVLYARLYDSRLLNWSVIIFINRSRKQTRLKGSKNDASKSTSGLPWPQCLTFCYDTTGICHNICLPGLVKIRQIVPKKSCRKGLLWHTSASCDLDLWPPDPKLTILCPWPWTTCANLHKNHFRRFLPRNAMQTQPMSSCGVCLCVCHIRLSKRINISSKFFHHQVSTPF